MVKTREPFVKTQSAEELALRGRLAFDFLLKRSRKDRFYKQELIGWLKTGFANELPGSADNATVVALLKERLHEGVDVRKIRPSL